MADYDFSGWATKNNLKCADGRTIMKDAFKDNDGETVPLVWNHQHNDSFNVLGHALLKNKEDGVYAYCKFNDTPSGKNAKSLVEHGDVTALSIYANKLKQNGGNVLHGAIREVSLVLAGANPGALIDSVMLEHGAESEEEAVIFTGESIELSHADEEKPAAKEEPKEEPKVAAEAKQQESGKTIQEIYDTLNDEQKEMVNALVGLAVQDAKGGSDDNEDEGDSEDMKHNVFDNDEQQNYGVLSHSDMAEIISDAKRFGSLKESAIQHGAEDVTALAHTGGYGLADSFTETYGIGNVGYLFPEAKSLNTPPEFINRKIDWVKVVMNAVHHTPFSRIKSMFADITEDEARALGYTKGKLKKEEVFGLLKRTTTPTTIYKKQKMERDDIIDITDFVVVDWIKGEMRTKLDEEIARAILIGDGRLASSDDKINESCIRPIWTDADLYTVKVPVTYASGATDNEKAKQLIREIIKARKNYRGSGTPTFFTTEDTLTAMLLIEDTNGRVIYDSIDKLKTALRVADIQTVEVMENKTVTRDSVTYNLAGLIVNLADYNVGADKGGSVNMFEDFDIDYNQQKYLIETRCSGALIKPFAALAIETTSAT